MFKTATMIELSSPPLRSTPTLLSLVRRYRSVGSSIASRSKSRRLMFCFDGIYENASVITACIFLLKRTRCPGGTSCISVATVPMKLLISDEKKNESEVMA